MLYMFICYSDQNIGILVGTANGIFTWKVLINVFVAYK